ncbi:MAG: hypothetical protein R6X32_22895 [Chloroflexota bacterium]|jgi:hypothetical protein
MTMQTVSDTHEQTLLAIVRSLPVEQVKQVLDFARYIQIQTLDDFDFAEGATSEDVAADEARWDAQFAATQDGLKKMAASVRAEIQAGRSQPMHFTKDGKIAPG